MIRYNRVNIVIYTFLLNSITSIFCATSADIAAAQEIFASIARAKKVGHTFTQSQAHLSLPFVQQKVRTLSDLAHYKKIIHNAIAKEVEYNKDYDVFYTAIPYGHVNQDVTLHLFQDVIRKLYKRTEGAIGALKNKAFQFVRYTYKDPTYDKFSNVNDFIKAMIEKNGMVRDKDTVDGLYVGTILISANLALFGNISWGGECSWCFFMEPQKWTQIERKYFEDSIKSFGYTTAYVDELLNLAKYLVDGGLGTDLFQIFIPKKQVNTIAYLAWRFGIPFDKELVPQMLGKPTMTFGYTDREVANYGLVNFMKKWQADPAEKVISDTMLKRVLDGSYFLEPFLEKYRREPGSIFAIDNLQARLLVTNQYLLNPESGILIYRYYKIDPAKKEIYKKKLKEIITKMEKEKNEH